MPFGPNLVLILLSCAAIWLGVAVASAPAATTHIGAVGQIAGGADPASFTEGGFGVQVGEASGTYAVPVGFGVITAWSHSTGTAAGALTFKVYRPTGAAKEFVAVAADARAVTPDTVHEFPVRIPVRPGDRIGLSADEVQLAYESGDPADRIGFFSSDPAPGAVDTTDGEPFPSFKLDVAARVETDSDGDGLGDDTQDSEVRAYPLPRQASSGTDTDGDGISDLNEARGGTDPLDRDTDDDGIADGREDRNRDGRKGRKESSPRRRDSDRDGLTDGVERGVRKPVADPPGRVRGTNRKRFRRDRDPRTRTNALRRDSDGDGLSDGREDSDHDGKRDRGETNPRSRDSDHDGVPDKRDSSPLFKRRD
ncbi:MAG: hypothetical protein M3301_06465 [Chloroflexota bacterium]|nr:hypothetical protein [Chloroflexota bacterium]